MELLRKIRGFTVFLKVISEFDLSVSVIWRKIREFGVAYFLMM